MFADRNRRVQVATGRRPKGLALARIQTGFLIFSVLSFMVVGSPAISGEYLLGTARTAGQVGEKLDGYLELIDLSAPENIKLMVKDTNERRRARYAAIAEKRGTTIESVGKQAGAKIIARAKAGEMIQDAAGKWTKK